MNHLIRGAGSVNPNQGVELVRNPREEATPAKIEGDVSSPAEVIGPGGDLGPRQAEAVNEGEHWARVGWSITKLAAREIELSYAGGCDAALGPERTWLEDLRPVKRPFLEKDGRGLDGLNIFVLV